MIDWNKPVRTRDGRAVRVLCTDRVTDSDYKVLALVKSANGYENVWAYTIEGKYHGLGYADKLDLENVPERTTFYLSTYPKGRLTREDVESGRLVMYSHSYPHDSDIRVTFEGDDLVEVGKVDD